MVEVTQADRECFADALGLGPVFREKVLAGDYDKSIGLQTIAAHRIAERERNAGTDTCEMPEVAAMRYIEELRSDFGSVTILPDNDEANHRSEQVGIDCCGEWTNWQDQRFMGESVLQCLAIAVGVKAKSQAIRGQSNGA